ncbi:Molybdate ABC transporter, permease protein [Desulfonema limicola]|uniref:Molybdenum transport system permease n=1 Tax=Desulfonema limicola TaxID=45656 RepID=A0A975B6A8_9BACT|nr:ABC transporter permease [Desulfonema limicola]QTA79593.1 Molybdate ABC transporter, permease protein [Desulfonema limicola]
MKYLFFDLCIAILAGVFVCFVIFPMTALFTTTSLAELSNQLISSQVLSAVIISFETSIIVVVLSLFLGIPVAYLLAVKDFKGKVILDTLVDLPITIPPLVSGLALLIILGGNSRLGSMLCSNGIEIIFSKKGIIIAQLFVSSPFLIKSAREAFESINKNISHASLVLGASQFYTFKKIMLPLAKNGIYAGMVMTWARALGEFGATAMVAGCIPFKTQTMTVGIYQNVMSGELSVSIAIALILTLFSFTLLVIFKSRFKRQFAV